MSADAYIREIHRVAAEAREPGRRMEYIEAVCEAFFAGQPIPDGSHIRGDSVRRLIRQVLRRTSPAGREACVGWLREGRVPPAPTCDPVEEAAHG